MTTQIPNDLTPFVERLVAERRYLNASDVVAEALRLLQKRELLREEVEKGVAQLDAGQRIAGKEAYARAEQRIAEIERSR